MIETIFTVIFIASFLLMAALTMWGGQYLIDAVQPPIYVKIPLYLFTAVSIIFLLYCAYWMPIVVYTDFTTFDFMG